METRVHMFLDDFPTEDLICAYPAVKRPLRRRVTPFRPAQGRTSPEESVLLLDPKPGLVKGMLFRDLCQANPFIRHRPVY